MKKNESTPPPSSGSDKSSLCTLVLVGRVFLSHTYITSLVIPSPCPVSSESLLDEQNILLRRWNVYTLSTVSAECTTYTCMTSCLVLRKAATECLCHILGTVK